MTTAISSSLAAMEAAITAAVTASLEVEFALGEAFELCSVAEGSFFDEKNAQYVVKVLE